VAYDNSFQTRPILDSNPSQVSLTLICKLESDWCIGTLDIEIAGENLNLEGIMLWTILVVLLVLWLLGLVGGIGGNLIHVLLVVAAIALIFNLLNGRRRTL